MVKKEWTLSQIMQFDEIIDVRSALEFANDHIPNAVNCPVLTDEQRVQIGTLHKQESAFTARRQGAALIARNIADHIETRFNARPKDWRPLIYCWRGGLRSHAMMTVFNSIGWRAEQLPGGYKTFRHCVINTLEELSNRINFFVLCGPTGVGKSRLLEALKQSTAQVLDLEKLANHKGSVLGEPLNGEQPSQKRFESTVCAALQSFDLTEPVYVESESRRIGNIQIPQTLIDALRRGHCIKLEAELEQRAQFLIDEYHHFIDQPTLFKDALRRLKPYVGNDQVEEWYQNFDSGDITQTVIDLMVKYYDPFYSRSINKHFPRYKDALAFQIKNMNSEGFAQSATAIIKRND